MVKCLNIGKNIGKPIYRSISTIYLHLSHVNPLSSTERDKLYMWQAVQTKAGEEAITHCDWWLILTYHFCFINLWKMERERNETEWKKENSNRCEYKLEWQANRLTNAIALHSWF